MQLELHCFPWPSFFVILFFHFYLAFNDDFLMRSNFSNYYITINFD